MTQAAVLASLLEAQIASSGIGMKKRNRDINWRIRALGVRVCYMLCSFVNIAYKRVPAQRWRGDRLAGAGSLAVLECDLPRQRSWPGRRLAAMTRHRCMVSWQQKALVEATLISGPASVGIAMEDSRAIVEVGMLTTLSVCGPFALA